MLGFTLSKLNLLILVTALFAIVSFFLFGLTDLIVSDLAQQNVKAYSETVFGLVTGDILCRKSTVTIPEAIEYFGGLSPTKRFYYMMYIKRFPPEGVEEGKLNTLIFQIASRKEQDKIIATSSIDLNSNIYLFGWDSESTDTIIEQPTITLDPESPGIATRNSMVLVKEIFGGNNNLYVIACSSAAGLCERNLTWAACWLSKCGDPPRNSTCFPTVTEGECSTMGVTC